MDEETTLDKTLEVCSRLVECPDCTRLVSPKAKACPGCGCPVKKTLGGKDRGDGEYEDDDGDKKKRTFSVRVTEKIVARIISWIIAGAAIGATMHFFGRS